MKTISQGWAEPFRNVVRQVPKDSTIQSIRLQNWVPEIGAWENFDERLALVGDAAHMMTMCR
jgi:2-polyprenyl-6-methoxyphenol hydroxylase-like FAD-dependent oxidoreductase